MRPLVEVGRPVAAGALPLTRRRAAAITVGLALLALLQVTVVAFLPTPVAAPDLVAVAVLALAHAHGPVVGGIAGAWAGLLLDLLPPAAGPLGGWMLALGLAGAGLGRVAAAARPGPLASLLLVALGAAAVVLLRAAVVWFAGVPVGAGVLAVAAASAAYGLLLAPVALLVVTPRAVRRSRRRPVQPVGVPVE